MPIFTCRIQIQAFTSGKKIASIRAPRSSIYAFEHRLAPLHSGAGQRRTYGDQHVKTRGVSPSCRISASVTLPRVIVAGAFAVAICAAQPKDPGVRPGDAGAGGHLPGVTGLELNSFFDGLTAFQEVDGVVEGLGPRFNLDSCAGCHAFPAVGGASPAVNPQIALATKMQARNTVPWFLSSGGPIREARFKRNADGTPDGGVHGLFTISGRVDAPDANIQQPDFSNHSNIVFRIPTPTFGAGLIESIPDSTLKTNLQANAARKAAWVSPAGSTPTATMEQ